MTDTAFTPSSDVSQKNFPEQNSREKNFPKKNFRGRLASGEANPVDVHIGKRLRMRRMLLGLSQGELAEIIGVAFQQIQKYECAINRISTARLWTIAQALQCTISYFYDDMGGTEGHDSPLTDTGSGRDSLASQQETIKLVRAYYTIKHPQTRRQILALATSLEATGLATAGGSAGA